MNATDTAPLSTESVNSQIHPFARYLRDRDPATFPAIHEYANLFPMLEMDEMQKLADSIRANGQQECIVYYDGQLLDGRNRWVGCVIADKKPWIVDLKKDGGIDPLSYVIIKNLERRHLTVAQRAIIAEKIATARLGGQKKDEQAPTIKEAAAKVGVSERTVHDVRKLKTEAPGVYQDLDDKKHKNVNAAVKAAGLTKSKKRTLPTSAPAAKAPTILPDSSSARTKEWNRTHPPQPPSATNAAEVTPTPESSTQPTPAEPDFEGSLSELKEVSKRVKELAQEVVRLRKENSELRQMRQPDAQAGMMDPALILQAEDAIKNQSDEKPTRDLIDASFDQWFAQWDGWDECIVAERILDKVLAAALVNGPKAVKEAVCRQFIKAGLMPSASKK